MSARNEGKFNTGRQYRKGKIGELLNKLHCSFNCGIKNKNIGSDNKCYEKLKRFYFE